MSEKDLKRQVADLQRRVDNLTRMNGILRRLVLALSKSNAVTTQLPRSEDRPKRLH